MESRLADNRPDRVALPISEAIRNRQNLFDLILRQDTEGIREAKNELLHLIHKQIEVPATSDDQR